MAERYAALSDEARVFRTVRVGGGFLPEGHRMPKPDWIEPQKADKEEAQKSGRDAGLSVWKTPLATHKDSCNHRGVQTEDHRSFVIIVGEAKQIGQKHQRPLTVVADPVSFDSSSTHHSQIPPSEIKQFQLALEDHSLIEGIAKPGGLDKAKHKLFLSELSGCFKPLG